MILIDSDVAIDLLRGYGAALEWFDELPADEVVVLSGYSVIELIKGTRNRHHLRRIQRWLTGVRVVWLSAEGCPTALDIFGEFKLSHNLSAFDSLIGQTAVENGIVLCSFNSKHLGLVPEIQLSQPYVRE